MTTDRPPRRKPIRMWLERRRFRRMMKPRGLRGRAAPSPARPRRPGPIQRWKARRDIRKAQALPSAPRPGPIGRWKARRAMRSPAAAKLSRVRVPMRERLSAAVHRPTTLKPERPSVLERLQARAHIRESTPMGPPRAPVFRGKSEKLIAGVVAGSLSVVVLTWLVSRTPAPVSSADPLQIVQPQTDEPLTLFDEVEPTPTKTAPVASPGTPTAPSADDTDPGGSVITDGPVVGPTGP